MTKQLYYAVNGSGQGCVFASMPERDDHFKVWKGEIVGTYCSLVMQMESEGFTLPPLKWTDDPVTIEITLNIRTNQ